MAINRYTQTSQARYNPRSLQEMMLAPQYMRENHSKLEENMAEHAGLLDEISSYPAHSKAAKAEKERLLSALQERVEGLSTHGFSPQAKSDFMKFSKDYKHSLSPEGTLGRIQAANKSITEGLEESQKLHKEAKWSPEIAKLRADRMLQKYNKNFEETGEIQDIEFEAPPMKQNIEDDFTKLKGLLGSTTVKQSAETLMGNGNVPTDQTLAQLGYMPEMDRASGKIILKSPKGHVLNTENYSQLDGMLKYISDKWLGPMGEGTASDAWEQYDPEQRMRDIENLGTSVNKSTTENMLGVSRTMASPEKPTETETENLDPTVYMERVKTHSINNGGMDNTIAGANDVMNNPRSTVEERTVAANVKVNAHEIQEKWKNSEAGQMYENSELKSIVDSLEQKYGVDVMDEEFELFSPPLIGRQDYMLSATLKDAQKYGDLFNEEGVLYLDKQDAELIERYKDEKLQLEKERDAFYNEELDKKGYERVNYLYKGFLNDKKKNEINNIIATRVLTSNNMKVLSAQTIDASAHREDIEINPKNSRQLMDLIKLDGVKLVAADLSEDLGGFGYHITLEVKTSKERRDLDGITFPPNSSTNVEFFTGLSDLTDGLGNKLSHAAIIEQFPESHQLQVERYLNTRDIVPISGTRSHEENTAEIDNKGVPINYYSSDRNLLSDDAKIGVIATPIQDPITGEYKSYYTPHVSYTRNGNRTSDPMNWRYLLEGIIPNEEGGVESGNRKQEAFMNYVFENTGAVTELLRFESPEVYNQLSNIPLDDVDARYTSLLILMNELNRLKDSEEDIKLSSTSQMEDIRMFSAMQQFKND